MTALILPHAKTFLTKIRTPRMTHGNLPYG